MSRRHPLSQNDGCQALRKTKLWLILSVEGVPGRSGISRDERLTVMSPHAVLYTCLAFIALSCAQCLTYETDRKVRRCRSIDIEALLRLPV